MTWKTEESEKLTALYKELLDLEQVSEKMGKSIPSIRSKLVNLGLYKAKKKEMKNKKMAEKPELIKKVCDKFKLIGGDNQLKYLTIANLKKLLEDS